MFILPLSGERKAVELGRDDFFGRGGRLSPDSRFLAFNSNASGKFEVYVSAIDPATGTRRAGAAGAPSASAKVSAEGGIGGIVWRKDGKELFYLSQPPRQTIMAVELTTAPAFEARAPQRLFEIPGPIGAPAQLSNVSSPDGQRFVFAVSVARKPVPR